MTTTRALAVAALAAVAAAGAGCGDPSRSGTASGTFHTYVPSEMKGFDPTQAGEETTTALVVNYYDPLYEFEYLARPFALRPCLAKAMPEVSDDGLTYTIRLKEGVRYADDPCFAASGGRGREVTAHDVVFCFLRLMDTKVDSKGAWIFQGQVEGIDAFAKFAAEQPKDMRRSAYTREKGYPAVPGFEALDDRTLRVRLVKPYPQFQWVLAMPYASIYPPEAIARYGEDFMTHPVSTGPYLLQEFHAEQRAVFVRNPDYRRDDVYPSEGSPGDEAKPWRLGAAGRPLPQNERVVVTVHKESQPLWLSFEDGKLDRAVVPKDNFASAVDPVTREILPRLAEKGIRLEKDPRLEVIYQCFNMQDALVGKGEKARALRRAISLATDFDWATHHLYNDRVTRVDGPLIVEFPEFDPTFENPWKPRKGEARESAVARARAELVRAGVDVKTLPPVYVEVQDSTIDRQFFLAEQRDLKDIGIRFEARTVTWQEMQERIDRGQAQTWGISWGADYPDAQNFLQLFYGPNRPPGPNGADYQNPEFDRLYEEASTLMPGPRRTELYRRMQQIVVDDCVWVFKYRRLQFTFQHSWLTGYRYNDLTPRAWKYCRVDRGDPASDGSRRRVNWVPLYVLVAIVAVLATAMVLSARGVKRGW